MATAPAPDDAPASLIRCDATVVSLNGQRIVMLPADSSATLPSRGQVAITGTVNGKSLQTVAEPDGRRGHWIKLDERLPQRGLAPGDVATLEFAVAAEWPEPDVPADLQTALDDAPDLDDVWKSITPMARWEWVRWVRATKNVETRARRVEVGISKLRSGKRRPCCFDLAACTDPDLAKSGKLISPSD